MIWTIKRKFILLSLLNLAAIVTVAGIGYRTLSTVLASGKSLVSIQSILRAQGDADMMHDAINSDVLNAIVLGEGNASSSTSLIAQTAYQELLARFSQHRQKILRAVQVVEKSDSLPEDSKGKTQGVYRSLTDYIGSADSILKGVASNLSETKNRLPEFDASFAKLEGDMASLSDEIEATATVVQREAQQHASGATGTLFATGLVAAILVSLLSVLMARSIVPQLRKAVDVAKAIADGDLRHDIAIGSRDEVGELMRAFHAMSEGLNNKISHISNEVGRASRSVLDSAQQLMIGNETLSSSTEAQASTVEETVASMEQLASNTKHNSEQAGQISHEVREVSRVFRQGNEAVAQLAGTMTQINSSSKRIAEITALIDGIAFQTNILALNASVEAARAGESGRGFSVVATEVRNLAQRSSEASKEIKALIDAAVDKAEFGSSQAEQARHSMEASQDAVTRVTTLVLDIANASKEQNEGIGEMNEAIIQIDHTTQQNAALVEQAAAATKLLQEDAARLVELTTVFLTAPKTNAATQQNLTSMAQHKATSSPVRQHPTTAHRPKQMLQTSEANTDDWREF